VEALLRRRSCYFAGDGHFYYAGLQALTKEQAAALPGGVPGTVSGNRSDIYTWSFWLRLTERQEAPDGKVYSDTIREVKDGKLVWEWKVAEKLDPKVFPLQHHYPREHWPLINAI
jgi:hypothetical protein